MRWWSAALVACGHSALLRAPSGDAAAAAASTASAADAAEAALVKNEDILPDAQGYEAEAATSAKAAADAEAEARTLLAATRASAKQAAIEAAREEFKRVKQYAADQASKAKADAAAAQKEAEDKAALAAAKAAEPYNQGVMRSQKTAWDYTNTANQLAAAGNILKQQAAQMASRANSYQGVGQTIQAQQMMVQAHSLFASAEADQEKARELHATAASVLAGVPAYTLAATAASDAAEAANRPPVPEPPSPY